MQILSIPTRKRIYSIAFSPNGQQLASVSQDGHARIWDLVTGQVIRSMAVQETSCGHDLTYLDGERVVVAGFGINWWNLTDNGWNNISPLSLWRRQIRLSPDGRFLALADEAESTDWPQNGVFVMNTDDWSHRHRPEQYDFTTGGIAFSPNGEYLATRHIVRVGTKQRSLGVYGNYTTNDYDYVVHVRTMPLGQIYQTSDGWQKGVHALAFSPDGRYLAGGAGPRLRIWDVEENREVALHKRGTKHFQGLSFTADGRYLASVSNDETVRIWETRTWQEHTTFTWQIGRLLNIVFAPDGLRAAAASDKGKIVIWDVEE